MNPNEEKIFNALMAGWGSVTIEGIEIKLKSLSRDTKANKEREAYKRATKLAGLL